jgi:hypothetical protein
MEDKKIFKELKYKGFKLFQVIHNNNETFVMAEPININDIITKVKETTIAGENFEEVKRKIDKNFKKNIKYNG